MARKKMQLILKQFRSTTKKKLNFNYGSGIQETELR